MSQQSMRECRKAAINSQKMSKDCTSRAKRLSREMVSYWKRFEKVEKDIRKKAEKEAQEQRKMDLELREVSRLESFHLKSLLRFFIAVILYFVVPRNIM